MSQQSDDATFERNALLNKPGIVGARWWNRSLAAQQQSADATVNRRGALVAMMMGVGAVAACGIGIAAAVSDDFDYQQRNSLDVQRTYGWDFGAQTEMLVYNGSAYLPYDPALAARIEQDLAPARGIAFHIPTLLQSVIASPTARASEETAPFRPLYSVLRPVSDAATNVAYLRGASLAALFENRSAPVAVVVDLPGPESVAFAAGLASQLEPVLMIDNWPHPRGVVGAHLTLGALVYYQPLFVTRRGERPPTAMPAFVLDRNRLAFYSDAGERFDNRHFVRFPPASALRLSGITKVLYVVPTGNDVPELDDLNESFVALNEAGVEVRCVAADAFSDVGQGGYFYGGTAETHEGFWVDYPWAPRSPSAASPFLMSARPRAYTPVRRPTQFMAGRAPPNFSLVNVVLAAGTATVLGAAFNRAGSWNRSSGGWGG